jgi:hypothetical protein
LIEAPVNSIRNYRMPLKIQISSQLLRCVKNFLLAYKTYAARRNVFRALHLGEI